MNESRTNPVAQEKANGELQRTQMNLQIMTKLAEIGLNFLKAQLPGMKDIIEKKQANITQEQYDEFELLAKEGENVIKHFDGICQYMFEKKEKTES